MSLSALTTCARFICTVMILDGDLADSTLTFHIGVQPPALLISIEATLCVANLLRYEILQMDQDGSGAYSRLKSIF